MAQALPAQTRLNQHAGAGALLAVFTMTYRKMALPWLFDVITVVTEFDEHVHV